MSPAARHMQRGSLNQSTSTDSKTHDPISPVVGSSTTTAAQHAMILRELRTGPNTTDQLRICGAYTPGARVFELRALGYSISTELHDGYAADAMEHKRLARYTLHEPADMAQPCVDLDAEQKRFATLAAHFAIAGHDLNKATKKDSPAPFYVARWGWLQPVQSLDHAEQLLKQISGAKR